VVTIYYWPTKDAWGDDVVGIQVCRRRIFGWPANIQAGSIPLVGSARETAAAWAGVNGYRKPKLVEGLGSWAEDWTGGTVMRRIYYWDSSWAETTDVSVCVYERPLLGRWKRVGSVSLPVSGDMKEAVRAWAKKQGYKRPRLLVGPPPLSR
jgi:hypothetical protein